METDHLKFKELIIHLYLSKYLCDIGLIFISILAIAVTGIPYEIILNDFVKYQKPNVKLNYVKVS